MTVMPESRTFEAYLALSEGAEKQYEFVNGEMVELPPESEPNRSIANFLFLKLVEAGMPTGGGAKPCPRPELEFFLRETDRFRSGRGLSTQMSSVLPAGHPGILADSPPGKDDPRSGHI